MPESPKILAQLESPAGGWHNLYTAPSGSQVVVSTLGVMNPTTGVLHFHFAVSPDGAALTGAHHTIIGLYLAAGETRILHPGITMDAGDVLRGYCIAAGGILHAYGVEIT